MFCSTTIVLSDQMEDALAILTLESIHIVRIKGWISLASYSSLPLPLT